MTCADIDLNRRQQQARHGQRRITGFAHGDEAVFIHSVMDMDACTPFFTYCRFPTIVIAAGRFIVVTQKQAGFIGQAQQPPDGTVKNASVATGKSARAVP